MTRRAAGATGTTGAPARPLGRILHGSLRDGRRHTAGRDSHPPRPAADAAAATRRTGSTCSPERCSSCWSSAYRWSAPSTCR
ncbi:hypothetical protein NKG94_49640 [Micromonospora sp. M12]